MASMDLDDPNFWDNENYTLEQIVQKGLPQAVRVCEGFCGVDDIISFSCGDYLALEYVKPLTKVSARYIDQTRRIISSSFTIPIGYSGKVKMMYTCRLFKSVQELIKVFPRYVQVQKSMVVNGEDSSFDLPVGSGVELEKVFQSKGLICKYNTKSFLLNLEDNIEWSSVRDGNEYTIKEIVDRLPFPQYVEFLDSDCEKVIFWNIDAAMDNAQNFSGFVRLESIVNEEVIVGHHKESGSISQKSERGHRALLVLPLDSPEIKEIKVQLPLVKDNQIHMYDTIAVRKIIDDLNEKESGLYRDIQYVKRNCLANENTPAYGCFVYENVNEHDDPPTPPVPPKTYRVSKKDDKVISDSHGGAKTFERSVSCPDTGRDEDQVVLRTENTQTPSFALSEMSYFNQKGSQKNEPACRPKTMKKQMKNDGEAIGCDDNTTTLPQDSKKKKGILERTKSLNFNKMKRRLSEISMRDIKTATKTAVTYIFKKSSGLFEVQDQDKSTGNSKVPDQNQRVSGLYDSIDNEREVDDYEQLSDDTYIYFDNTETHKGNGASNNQNDFGHYPENPSENGPPNDETIDNQSPIASYTTEELVESLRHCKLESFADYCERKKLNGKDLINLSESKLEKKPHNLKKLEIRKIQMLKKQGWTPNMGNESENTYM